MARSAKTAEPAQTPPSENPTTPRSPSGPVEMPGATNGPRVESAFGSRAWGDQRQSNTRAADVPRLRPREVDYKELWEITVEEVQALPVLRWLRLHAHDIEPIRVNFNEHVGRIERPEWLGAGYGWQYIRPHHDRGVMSSFAQEGIRNPVFLWHRWDRFLVRWGGSRVAFARAEEIPIEAFVVDFDNKLESFGGEIDPMDAIRKFVGGPNSVIPEKFVVRRQRDLDLEVPLWRDRRI